MVLGAMKKDETRGGGKLPGMSGQAGLWVAVFYANKITIGVDYTESNRVQVLVISCRLVLVFCLKEKNR